MDNLRKLFDPKSIAIVGASEEKGKVGKAISENILNLGYEGKVFLVNPKHEKLFNRECYPSIESIREPVDLAIIAIPAKFVNQAIQNGGDSVKNFVVISAGFSETSEEGKKLEQELLEIAKEKKLNILGPNCLGFIAPKIKLNASFAGGLPNFGNISFVSQSGAIISALLDIASRDNIGFSNIISIGNKMSLSENELLEYLENDEDSKVIGMYLEGIKDGIRFKEIAKKISKSKPVVILKAGKTEKSQRAISSHTGALAGSEEIIKALFKKTGVIRVDSLDEFINTMRLISLVNPPANEKTAVITNAGGPGVLATDAFSGKEIKLSELDGKTKEKLREFLPKESSIENPIDLLGDAQEDRYEKTLESVDAENIGSIITILTPQENTPFDKIAQKISAFKKKTQKTIVAVFLGGKKIEKSVEILKNSKIPNYTFPEDAINALDKYYQWEINKNKIGIRGNAIEIDKNKSEKAENIIKNARLENRTALYFREAKEIMDIYGIDTIEFQEVNAEKELEIDFPMVMKVDSDKVLHKTDKQGVILNIGDENDFREAYQKMSENFPKENIIIQPMQRIETELILGIKKDETVGPIVIFGLGGIYTEIFKMVDFLIPSVTISEIKETILKSPIKFLFEETRGQKAYDIENVADILLKLSVLAENLNEIKEFDINPLLIYNDGRKSLAIDVKIII
ncbi:MAG: acetate--CoA ligase family protein [Parcubacteria group bacterium]|jgi:acetyltransferase